MKHDTGRTAVTCTFALFMLMSVNSSSSLAAQGTDVDAIPYLGVGGRGEGGDLTWPQIHGGLHVEAGLKSTLDAVAHVAAWMTPLVCTPTGDPERDRLVCADSGWRADLGLNLAMLSSETGDAILFGGAGAGAGSQGDVYPTANARVGVVLSRLRVELRYERLFGAVDPTLLLVSAGFRLTP